MKTSLYQLAAGRNHTIPSIIYRWADEEKLFVVQQEIVTTGAYDWTHMKVDGYHLLAVANSYSGTPLSTTTVASDIYLWQDGAFLHFQALQVA